MLSRWRLVSVNGDTNASGCYEIYANACRLVIEDIVTGTFETVSGNEIFDKRIIGVAPLSHRLMAISEVSKAEQKALNLLDIDFRYLRDRSTNEWLGNYVYGEVLQEMSVNFLDLIYSSLHEETSQALSKLNKVGTAEFYADTGYDHRIYRSTYKVSDLAKFELAYTKYKILQR